MTDLSSFINEWWALVLIFAFLVVVFMYFNALGSHLWCWNNVISIFFPPFFQQRYRLIQCLDTGKATGKRHEISLLNHLFYLFQVTIQQRFSTAIVLIIMNSGYTFLRLWSWLFYLFVSLFKADSYQRSLGVGSSITKDVQLHRSQSREERNCLRWYTWDG